MQMIAKKASFNLPSAAYLGQIYDYFLYHPNNVRLKYENMKGCNPLCVMGCSGDAAPTIIVVDASPRRPTLVKRIAQQTKGGEAPPLCP